MNRQEANKVSGKRGLVWGGLLILFGGMAWIEMVTEIGGWPWIVMLLLGGFGALGVFLTARSERWMVYVSYTLFTVAILVTLILAGMLEGLVIAAYVLAVIAAPLFVSYAKDPSQWWWLVMGGILSIVGVSLLISAKTALMIGPVVLILAGVFIVARIIFTNNKE